MPGLRDVHREIEASYACIVLFCEGNVVRSCLSITIGVVCSEWEVMVRKDYRKAAYYLKISPTTQDLPLLRCFWAT